MKVRSQTTVEIELDMSTVIEAVEEASPLELVHLFNALTKALTPAGVTEIRDFLGTNISKFHETLLDSLDELVHLRLRERDG